MNSNDGGFFSRKLLLIVFTMFLVCLGAGAAAAYPGFAPSYQTMVGALMGLAGLYITGNVAHTHVTGKHIVALKEAEVAPEDPTPEEAEDPPAEK